MLHCNRNGDQPGRPDVLCANKRGGRFGTLSRQATVIVEGWRAVATVGGATGVRLRLMVPPRGAIFHVPEV
jgi:hypothetical protein